jgi:RNA polymerase sigma-70 factor, ECF subfamily
MLSLVVSSRTDEAPAQDAERVQRDAQLAALLARAADLEDVLAEAYLQVWRKAGSFDAHRGSAVTWLLLIVRSRALDLLRKPHEEQLDEEQAPELPATDPGPPDVLETTQANAALHAALAQLNAKERWALSLAYYRDMSHSEIAAATAMPLGTVKSLINRAQDKLRALLGS